MVTSTLTHFSATYIYLIYSVTNAKIKLHSDANWKYQKYGLIVDFEERLRLPPPLSVISYILMVLMAIYRCLHKCCKQCCATGCRSCKCCKKKNSKSKVWFSYTLYSTFSAFNFKEIVNCGIFSTFPFGFWHIEI